MDKQMRYSQAELSLIKSLFKQENDDNLLMLRAYFLGKGNLSEELKGDEIQSILKKTFYPQISLTAPIGQQVDLYMTIVLDNVSEDDRHINLEIRKRLIDFLENKLGGKGKEFDLDNLDLDLISIRTRNTYIGFVENQLVQLKTLANVPEPKELKNKSNK